MVALAFGLVTFDRWLRRRRPHELAWTIALALFVIGASALWWAESHGWNSPVFRLFFLTGAVLNVPWLALGTFYLLVGQTWGDRARAWLIWPLGTRHRDHISAPTKATVSGTEFPQGSEVFGLAPRLLAGIGSALPCAFDHRWRHLVGQRGSCAARHLRSIAQSRRAVSSPFAWCLEISSLRSGPSCSRSADVLAGRLGKDRAFAVTLLLGIVVLFAGFLTASAGSNRKLAALESGQRAA